MSQTNLDKVKKSMIAGAHQRIVNVVSSWAGVETLPHRFGGTEFRLGTRELGHIHGNVLVDIPFPKRIRNEVVEAGLAEPHHILPESGWISRWLREEVDVDRAIDLLRRSWQLAHDQRERLMGEELS